MIQNYDIIIIGTGAASSGVAYKCKFAGMSVAVIDELPYGGTCANRGCDPKKVLVGAAEVLDWARRMNGNGIDYQNLKINWKDLMTFKRSFTDPVPENREKHFHKAGIDTFHGSAEFTGDQSVKVGDKELTAKYIHIATGAKPARLNIPGEEYLTFSDQFLELDELPPNIVFVGGGYISMEFAHIAARAGVNVEIIHRGSRVLEKFDPDLVNQLTEATLEAGIKLRLNSSVEAILKKGNHLLVSTSTADSKETIEADMVVHGAGRMPAIENMNLEAAGIEWGRKGVKVNKYLQSVSNPHIYAAGDVADTEGLPLTPVAGSQSQIAASNIIKGNSKSVNYIGTPSVAFTIPQIASVGLTEEEAEKQGLKFKVKKKETDWWYSSKRIIEKHSGFKTLVEEDTGKIIGAHLLGSHAGEVINLFAMAIRFNIPASEIRRTIYAYPTNSSDVIYMV
ncbi:similar to glutathione reductase [hydrothermal vent metagenome]|uniref:Similar to glutathione reductase n=1 Tax=hydrothermal vent metagenome TaxID=652676 RepID=A0A3B1D357_9ZZZZ